MDSSQLKHRDYVQASKFCIATWRLWIKNVLPGTSWLQNRDQNYQMEEHDMYKFINSFIEYKNIPLEDI